MRHLAPRRFAPVDVAEELHDDQVLPGGLRVLHTPGHTPGHICLLHEPSGVLIVGDALMHIRRLRWPPTVLCTDGAQARQAAERLAGLDFEVAAFSHGRELRDHARESVRGFLHAREERR